MTDKKTIIKAIIKCDYCGNITYEELPIALVDSYCDVCSASCLNTIIAFKAYKKSRPKKK